LLGSASFPHLLIYLQWRHLSQSSGLSRRPLIAHFEVENKKPATRNTACWFRTGTFEQMVHFLPNLIIPALSKAGLAFFRGKSIFARTAEKKTGKTWLCRFATGSGSAEFNAQKQNNK